MRNLNYQLKNMRGRNQDGSFATQSDRGEILDLCANQLYDMGFRHMTAHSLKEKHVAALLERWNEAGLSTGTIKNRMSALRWWAEKIGKDNLIRRDNAAYGIADRQYVTNVSKAKVLLAEQYANVSDPYSTMSLRMQQAFGLRREESIKIKPQWADLGDKLRLRPSWTKGGKYREVPVSSAEQRAVLDAAKALAGSGSLIPKGMQYIDQLNRFKSQCQTAGINNVHGLRHSYAQRRYRELTGRACPSAGGLRSTQLDKEQKHTDRQARIIISAEMGHGREQITAQYLGR